MLNNLYKGLLRIHYITGIQYGVAAIVTHHGKNMEIGFGHTYF